MPPLPTPNEVGGGNPFGLEGGVVTLYTPHSCWPTQILKKILKKFYQKNFYYLWIFLPNFVLPYRPSTILMRCTSGPEAGGVSLYRMEPSLELNIRLAAYTS